MNSTAATRDSIENLDRAFISVLSQLVVLIQSMPPELIYQTSLSTSGGSVAENVVKSAASLEQAFGGLTANLWDDPFEWTLPETLSTPDLIVEYLTEVDGARMRAFASIVDDSALDKYIALPSGEQTSIQTLLLKAFETALVYEGQATETFKMLSADDAPRFII